jgi:sterol desaturase/sphingolipid hydroxylase (fatty acid hydroxylase superfamily)
MLGLVVFAAAALLALIEARRCAYDSPAQWRVEVRTSLVLGAAAVAMEALFPRQSAPLSWEHGAALALGVFLADDFLYYASHRLSHRVHLFWASHAVHHSPSRYNLFTGLRQPPTWLLTPAAAAPVLLLALGAPAALVAASATLRAVHHFLIHTERVRRLPAVVEYVFNTPAHHRVHHASETHLLDRNFGGVLIVWDRLFGTFCPEPAAGVRTYGLVHPLGDGAWRTFAGPGRRLCSAATRAPSLRRAALALFSPPASR